MGLVMNVLMSWFLWSLCASLVNKVLRVSPKMSAFIVACRVKHPCLSNATGTHEMWVKLFHEACGAVSCCFRLELLSQCAFHVERVVCAKILNIDSCWKDDVITIHVQWRPMIRTIKQERSYVVIGGNTICTKAHCTFCCCLTHRRHFRFPC